MAVSCVTVAVEDVPLVKVLFLALLCCHIVSCSIQRIAISQLAPALSEASPRLQQEKNWEFFKNATPGSLQLAEVLLEADPGNEDLLALLTKGFGAYGYVINDTEYLDDRLNDRDESPARQRGVFNLSKSLQYGFQYLEDRGVSFQGILNAARKNDALPYFNERLDSKSISDVETSFFTGTSWLLLANMKKDNLELVSQISAAFELINWVCHHRPQFQNGLCTTMKAVFFLARPKSLGGKPKLALKLLNQTMKDHPQNLLIPVVYLEWYVIPFMKDGEYKKLKPQLAEKFTKFRQQFYVPGKKAQPGHKMLHLFNAMAEKRFFTIVKSEDELF